MLNLTAFKLRSKLGFLKGAFFNAGGLFPFIHLTVKTWTWFIQEHLIHLNGKNSFIVPKTCLASASKKIMRKKEVKGFLKEKRASGREKIMSKRRINF